MENKGEKQVKEDQAVNQAEQKAINDEGVERASEAR